MSETTIKPDEGMVVAAPGRASNDDRPTAKILSDFYRELLAEGFADEAATNLVTMAAREMLGRGSLITDGRSKPKGGAA
jgi:hypothetical protein